MIADRGESNRLEEELAEESHRNRLRSRAYGLHSWHGFFPAWIASSRLAYLTTFFAENRHHIPVNTRAAWGLEPGLGSVLNDHELCSVVSRSAAFGPDSRANQVSRNV